MTRQQLVRAGYKPPEFKHEVNPEDGMSKGGYR